MKNIETITAIIEARSDARRRELDRPDRKRERDELNFIQTKETSARNTAMKTDDEH